MENIIRNTTEADKQYLDIDLNKSKRRRTAREIFQLELIKHEQDAVKKGIPFARHIARQDFEADIKKQADAQVKKYGSVEYPEEIKVPKNKLQKNFFKILIVIICLKCAAHFLR